MNWIRLPLRSDLANTARWPTPARRTSLTSRAQMSSPHRPPSIQLGLFSSRAFGYAAKTTNRWHRLRATAPPHRRQFRHQAPLDQVPHRRHRFRLHSFRCLRMRRFDFSSTDSDPDQWRACESSGPGCETTDPSTAATASLSLAEMSEDHRLQSATNWLPLVRLLSSSC